MPGAADDQAADETAGGEDGGTEDHRRYGEKAVVATCESVVGFDLTDFLGTPLDIEQHLVPLIGLRHPS